MSGLPSASASSANSNNCVWIPTTTLVTSVVTHSRARGSRLSERYAWMAGGAALQDGDS